MNEGFTNLEKGNDNIGKGVSVECFQIVGGTMVVDGRIFDVL